MAESLTGTQVTASARAGGSEAQGTVVAVDLAPQCTVETGAGPSYFLLIQTEDGQLITAPATKCRVVPPFGAVT
jgi:hypothetical protein